MTESELFSAYYDGMNVIHGNFEFWLSATFAFTLAFHFSRKSMTSFFKNMLVTLYFVASAIFISNWTSAGLLLMVFVEQIETANPEIVVRPISGVFVPTITFGVMILGTMAAIYFALKFEDKSSESET